MSISQIIGNKSSKITQPQQPLSPGQIIRGKVLKLYPDNKAQIQLNGQNLIAQIEASLSTDSRYYFQVQTTKDVLHLKVLGEHLKNQERNNAIKLMGQMGLQASKSSLTFVQTLINEEIPFEKNQLVQAFQLLDGAKNKTQGQLILKEIVKNKMPLTASVFQALLIKHSHHLSDQMESSLYQLKKDASQTQLTHRLSQLIEPPLAFKSTIVQRIITEVTDNNQQLFNTLKIAGAVESDMDFELWKSKWQSLPMIQQKQLNNPQNSYIELQVKIDENNMIDYFEQMKKNKSALLNQSQEIIHTYGHKMMEANATNMPLSALDYAQLKQQISQSLMPLFTSDQQQQLTNLLQNRPSQLQQLFSMLQTLNSKQTYAMAEQFLATIYENRLFLAATPRDQFLIQVNNTLLFTGLSYENNIANDNFQQQSITVKGMLIKLLHQIGSGNQNNIAYDSSRQLLHFINGLQLQSVNESNHFIQANLQIPAERIGLIKDLELEFEGAKTENGEINSDFCRILFYLNLKNLKETVIDMNIQQRAVAVTIFNDTNLVKEMAQTLKPILKSGLEALNYQLSNVSFKPLDQVDEHRLHKPEKYTHLSYKGVDFRI
ncbi:hypothetical protein [Virgibacillus ainsalahensis]